MSECSFYTVLCLLQGQKKRHMKHVSRSVKRHKKTSKKMYTDCLASESGWITSLANWHLSNCTIPSLPCIQGDGHMFCFPNSNQCIVYQEHIKQFKSNRCFTKHQPWRASSRNVLSVSAEVAPRFVGLWWRGGKLRWILELEQPGDFAASLTNQTGDLQLHPFKSAILQVRRATKEVI